MSISGSIPLTLSLSKGKGLWFDKLTMSVLK
jgi:hypothetical protein